MSYFLTTEDLFLGKEFDVQGEELAHLVSRRVKQGEVFEFQSPAGKRFLCKAVVCEKRRLVFQVLKELLCPNPPTKKVVLFQAMISENALDVVLQKTTELGVAEIVLFNSERTATKYVKEKILARKKRWEKILWEACKQSGRQFPPNLLFVDSLGMALEQIKNPETVFLCDPSGEKISKSAFGQNSFVVVVGPEGGLTDTEKDEIFKLRNFKKLKLGENVLRAETAAIAAVSVLLN